MRFFFRLLAFVSLAIAVIAAVIDASRSLSAEALMLTSLEAGWTTIAPDSLALMRTIITERLPAVAWDPISLFLLSMPASAVMAVLATLFYAIGAKREKPFGQIRIR